MTAKENSINWFEIPVTDISRAKSFYETIFGIEMPQQEMMGMQMAFFPTEDHEWQNIRQPGSWAHAQAQCGWGKALP
jgi:predicted enzyme related to lactoylglutathione lyase